MVCQNYIAHAKYVHIFLFLLLLLHRNICKVMRMMMMIRAVYLGQIISQHKICKCKIFQHSACTYKILMAHGWHYKRIYHILSANISSRKNCAGASFQQSFFSLTPYTHTLREKKQYLLTLWNLWKLQESGKVTHLQIAKMCFSHSRSSIYRLISNNWNSRVKYMKIVCIQYWKYVEMEIENEIHDNITNGALSFWVFYTI